jgi:hypothetical protein
VNSKSVVVVVVVCGCGGDDDVLSVAESYGMPSTRFLFPIPEGAFPGANGRLTRFRCEGAWL